MRKVAVEAVDPVRRRLAVEVPENEVTTEIEKAYSELRHKAKVPGFRPGRAPRPVLERLFGDQVRADVFGRLVQSSFLDVLREQQIEPVGRPEIVTEQAEPGQPLRYSVTVEVKPSLSVQGYVGLELERPLRSITESDVDRFLEELRQSFAQLLPIEDRSEAAPGDLATIDYQVKVDRSVQRFDNRLVEVAPAELGGELPARLDGMRIGQETSFAIDYPADHPDPERAGKRLEFRVVLKSMARKEVPNLDDDFAKDHGECETLEDLRQRVRQHLEGSALREADRAARAAAVRQLVRANDVQVPRAMLERRTELMVDEILENLGARRPPASREAEFRTHLQSQVEPRAREQVQGDLILEAVARQESLEVGEEEVEAYVEQIVNQTRADVRDRVRALYGDPSRRASLRTQILQEKALDFIMSRAQLRTIEAKSSVADAEGTG